MASKKLSPAQFELLERLNNATYGIAPSTRNFKQVTMIVLNDLGLAELKGNNYVSAWVITDKGRGVIASGTNHVIIDPTPDPDGSDETSTPETVALETLQVGDVVCPDDTSAYNALCEQGFATCTTVFPPLQSGYTAPTYRITDAGRARLESRTTTSDTLVLNSAIPVSDAEIPFAEGIDDSEPYGIEIDTPADRIAILNGEYPATSEPATRVQWTHHAADAIRNMLVDADPIAINYVLRVAGKPSVVSGHGRKTKRAKTAHSATQTGAMPTDTKKARKAAKIAEIKAKYANRERAVTPVTHKRRSILSIQQQIAILDALRIGRAA